MPLTSRPDLPIRLWFSKLARQNYKDFIIHDIPLEIIEKDISLFFNHRPEEIRTDRFLPIQWPGERDFERLVALSVPLFIFAAIICRIFEEPDWDPAESLTEILAHQNNRSKPDGTYLPILDRLLRRQHQDQKQLLVSQFHNVIGAIIILESPLSINSLSELLGVSGKLIHLRLNPLHSVLRVPQDDSTPI